MVETSDTRRPLATPAFWGLLALALVVGGFAFYQPLHDIVAQWMGREEYSYGLLIPAVSLYLAWQRWPAVMGQPVRPAWWSVPIMLAAVLLLLAGDLGSVRVLSQYGVMIAITALVLAVFGWRAAGIWWAPLALLYLAVPLPPFLYNNLSQELQLISSQIGVWLIRLFDISVFLQGNVIDLGHYKLQVVEACSGLRYLFPLMSFGFICAYLFRAPLWQRLLVFASSVPITVFMNSFRIGVIGVLVEHFGIQMAEGFLHDFEGWVIFMSAAFILVLEIWLLCLLSRRSFTHSFAVEPPHAFERRGVLRHGPPLIIMALLLLAGAATVMVLGGREHEVPARTAFVNFPDHIAQRESRGDALDAQVLAVLDLDDYLLRHYFRDGQPAVTLYVAYYASQQGGSAAHSPRSCIPGDGWEIGDFSTISVPVAEGRVPVNRVLISKGRYHQLVYYWFKQRDRHLTGELPVKGYLLLDAITRNRSDGALVRLSTEVHNDDIGAAERRLQAMTAEVVPVLPRFVPD